MRNKENIENILVVDDSGTARMIIRQCLEMAGLSGKCFYEARNGKEALEVLNTEKIDILLTDLNMPVMDGNMLLLNLTAMNGLKPLIMVITSASNPAKEAELKGLGADYVLNKPITPAGIIRVWNS